MTISKFKKTCIALAAGAGLVMAAAGGASAIVDGTESASGARPYQVSLQTDGQHYCGGSIIDATTIVTAAHCVQGESADTTTIRAGVTDVTSTSGQDVRVASITSHPNYAVEDLADVAIIKLAEPLTLGGDVQAIPLATAAQLDAATSGVVSGWGAVSETGGSSDKLLEAIVPLVSDQSCAVSIGSDAKTETCAGGTGTDSCYGDSGGALAVQSSSGPVLAGITSWGEECGGATPGVYADVPGLTEWINAAAEGNVPANISTEQPVDEEDDTDFSDDDYDYTDEDFANDVYADEDYDYSDDVYADEDYDYSDEDFYTDDFNYDDEDFYTDDFNYDDEDFYTDDFNYDDEDFYTDDFNYDDEDFYTDDFNYDDEDFYTDDFYTDDNFNYDD